MEEIIDEEIELDDQHDSELKIKKGNKRSKPELWIRNMRKQAKNAGQSYIASNGKCVNAKQMKDSCGDKCRIKCSNRMTNEQRKRNFDRFYAMADIEKQRKFLFDHMRSYEPKKLKLNQNSLKSRSVQRNYFLDVEKESSLIEVQVCRQMFLNTFSISSQMIDTIYRKFKEDKEFSDIRGKFQRKKYSTTDSE